MSTAPDCLNVVARAITRARIMKNPGAYLATSAGNLTPERLEAIIDSQVKYAMDEAQAALTAIQCLKDDPPKRQRRPSSKMTTLASRILRGGEYTHEEVKSLAACALALDPVKGQD